MNLQESLAIGAPEVVLAAGALVLLMIGVFRGDRSLQGLSWGAVILFALAAFIAFQPVALAGDFFVGC